MAEMSGLMILFLIVLAILWVALPFAVFGIKGKLDDIIKQLKILNESNKDAYR